MKSILYLSLFMACFIFLGYPSAQAQRHCDLSLHIISPEKRAEIPFGDTVEMYISVKNLGPDDIDSSDVFSFNMEGMPFGTRFTNENIPAGDSLVYNPYSTVSGQSDTDYHLVMCSYLNVESNTFVDNNPVNDSACLDVTLKAKENARLSLFPDKVFSARLYPNPAQNKLSLLMTLKQKDELYIVVQDPLGHTVQKEVLEARKGKNELPLNISHLAVGIYFIKVVDSNGHYWQEKLVIK